MSNSLQSIVSNGKRFLAYQIIKRLERLEQMELLNRLQSEVKVMEKNKGQRHKVFESSFDAQECYWRKFIEQKLNYIHHNPVSKKWRLVSDFRDYEYSSASFYDQGIKHYDKLLHIHEVW